MTKKIEELRDSIIRYISLYELNKGKKPPQVTVTQDQYFQLQQICPNFGDDMIIHGVKVMPHAQ